MAKKLVSFILLLLLALYVLNPPYEKHRVKLGEIPSPDMMEEKSSGPGSKYVYKNYVFCSEVKNAATGERESFGILGFVFK